MTPKLIAISAATVALAGLILNGNRGLTQRMDRLENRFASVEREQAHLAGLFEGLREAISSHRAA